MFAQAGLNRRPKMFDGVEIGRVSRKKQQLAACRRDQRGGAWRLVKPGVIQHDDAARRQHGQQHLFKINVHHLRRASARKGQWRDQPAVLGGGNDARPLPPLPRHGFINPFTSGRAPVFPIQPVIHAALVEVIHVGGRQLFQFAPEEPPLDFVVFAVFYEFFLA